MGDEYGRTDLEQVRLSLEEENTEKQYTLMIWTDGSAFHNDMQEPEQLLPEGRRQTQISP